MTIHHGDCIEVMAAMPEASVDAVVTDPPYGLEFMGKEWDRLDAGLPQENVWKGRRGGGGFAKAPTVAFKGEVRGPSFGAESQGFKRCQKCGKRAFSGSPCVCPEPDYVTEYNYGPSSQAIRMQRWHEQWAAAALRVAKPGAYLLAFGGTRTVHRMTVALEDAGWIIRDMLVWAYASGFPKSRALLKPAWEPIVMARKPGPLRELDIDGCRIATTQDERDWMRATARPNGETTGWGANQGTSMRAPAGFEPPEAGRWPANVVLTDPIFDGGIEGVVGGGETTSGGRTFDAGEAKVGARGNLHIRGGEYARDGDTGTYSRFFLIPKASRSDREPVMPGMLEERVGRTLAGGDYVSEGRTASKNGASKRANVHPTVKPIELMRHLVRLVTPPGGTVLDPFLGSGTTALAAEQEGRDWVGIEREAEYVAIAEARLAGWQRGLGLDVA